MYSTHDQIQCLVPLTGWKCFFDIGTLLTFNKLSSVCDIAPYSAILRHSPDCNRGMPPKKSYDFSFQLRAVELARSIGIRPAARQIGVDERRIREWITKEATLKKEEHPSKRRRLEGGGRKPDHS